jgi:hypothetical protein
MPKRFTLIATLALLGGCATNFVGSPHIEGGRHGCEAKCRGVGMVVGGMVYMGEYSSACVCEVPESSSRNAVAAGGGGAVGVILQMRRDDDDVSWLSWPTRVQ